MKSIIIAAAAVAASAAAATAGGYTAPVVETTPVVVAPEPSAITMDWTGFYAGGQVGKIDGSTTSPANVETDFDGKAYGLHAGYLHDFGKFVGGAELSYDKLSGLQADGSDVETDGSLLRGKLLAGYDAGRVLPYLAVGYADLTIDGVDGADDASGDGYFYGLGAKFKATENVLVGAEVLRHEFSDFDDVNDADVDATTIGLNVSYQF